MFDLLTQLSEEEFEYLDNFLLDRIDEDTYTEGKDEGVLDMSELDGLFTAIVSGPVMIPPSQWLQIVWGDFEPVWEREEDFELVFSLMMRHMNDIVSTLMEHPEDFEPIYHEREVDGRTYAIVDEWCEGYMQGVALAAKQWDSGGLEMRNLITPILAFTSRSEWSGHDLSNGEVENIKKVISPNVRDIHAYWLARREEYTPAPQPVRHSEAQVGRNDPCPCGSGKKYKKCCLH